jgi:hypothetical protein
MNSHRAGVVAIIFIGALLLLLGLLKYVPGGAGVKFASASAVTLTHTATENTHYYQGEALAAAPCDGFGIESTVAGDGAHVALKTQRLPGVTCDENPTPLSFSFSLTSPHAPKSIALSIDGKEMPVQIINK